MAAADARTGATDPDLGLIREAALEAGRIALGYFRKANEVWQKSGNSPVSEADLAVDRFLREELTSARPDYGWLSEETEDSSDRLERERIFVVDPIDGTRGFIAGRAEWCVSVAIVEAGRPVSGVLVCPAMDRLYEARSGEGAFLDGKRLSIASGTGLRTVTASRKLNEIIETSHSAGLDVIPFVPSLAYRIAMVAHGEVDAAFARPGAHDWDLAAADVILAEAGGALAALDRKPLLYNRPMPSFGSLLACGMGRLEASMRLAQSGGFLH